MLETIHSPEDVKKLQPNQLPELAASIRQRLIDVTAKNGGHIGPNLGVVELTLALHRVFETPKDKFVFDVAHQGYVHKLLTGRNNEKFEKIRESGGYAGFLMRSESEHDAYGAGHAGTALSAALGMAVARDRKGTDESVVALCGDAAFTCGITLEALNNVAESTKKLVVILNDNEFSIAKNVGAISKYLNTLITNPGYEQANDTLKKLISKLPAGERLTSAIKQWKKDTKDLLVPSSLFEHFGMRYIGPIDGHNLPLLQQHLEHAKQSEKPILLHVITQKGRGLEAALANPEKFHGCGAYNPQTGKSEPSKPGAAPKYQDAFANALVKEAQGNKNVVGITAAMPSGTSLSKLEAACPQQFFDVGIAEEHAVLFAAGMATQGMQPVCAIYSTFLQRALDPIVHDVCLQKLPVVFAQDRAGVAAQDGPTHHGLFDIALHRSLPGAIIAQPKNEDELADLLHTALARKDGPTFLRYPRGSAVGVPVKETPALLEVGTADVITRPENEAGAAHIWALGPWVQTAESILPALAEQNPGTAFGLTNARYVKPLDIALLKQQAEAGAKLFVSMEDHARTGGLGSTIIEILHEMGYGHIPVVRIAWPDDHFLPHATNNDDLKKICGITNTDVIQTIHNALQKAAASAAAIA